MIRREKEINDTRMLIFELDRAFEQWTTAERNFHEITGNDRIDYAIFAVEAAEKRYEYLLREAKNKKITVQKKLEK